MAINDPTYRYATQTWEADGVRTQYDIAFTGGYLYQADVVAFSVAVDPATGLVTDRVSHTVVFLSESVDANGWKTAQVEITPAVAAGRRVVIYRSTEKKSPLVKYLDGSVLTHANLDLANKQNVFGIAEIMDGLNQAGIDINEQISQVIDMNQLIESIYTTVLQLLAQGGIVVAEPRVWFGTGNVDGDTDFPVVGADVSFSGMYDVYVAGLGLIPEEDYTVLTGLDPADSVLRFTTAPGNGVEWFAVLRGYASTPLAGGGGGTIGGVDGEPVANSLRIKIINNALTSYFADANTERGLVRCTNVAANTITIKLIPTTGTRMGSGSYFNAEQVDTGQVTITVESGGEILVPPGYVAKTRAQHSVISATCVDPDANVWLVSGDLALA